MEGSEILRMKMALSPIDKSSDTRFSNIQCVRLLTLCDFVIYLNFI